MQEYLNLVEKLKSSPTVKPGSPEADAGVDRFKTFFADMTEKSVRELTPVTYAPDAFFNDTLKTVRGADAVEHYFLETVKNAESVRATVHDVAVSDGNYYVRWTMEVRLAKFKRGQTLRSIGITHLRFDEQGRILIHQDYWDSTAGFFEHLPVLGGLIRAIKSRI
ncbi:MAG: nuclear transport factor 2 family protein [Chthoniobacterales bacterium]